jgi:TPR repeat protein
LTKNQRIVALTILLMIALGVLLSVGEPTVDEREANAALDQAYKAGDFKTAAELATKYANQGNIHAQVMLGTLYRKGEGVATDPMKAVSWYRVAADRGDAYARNTLGEMFLTGGAPRRDYGLALMYFRQAARQGLDQAKFNLCGMYYREQEISWDYQQVVKKMRMQAHMTNSMAPYEMAQMYLDGTSPESHVQDYRKAARWFRLAAQQGMPNAQIELGKLYQQGLGVTQDYVAAHMWFNVAASLLSNTYVEGDRMDAVRRRDAVAARMTPDQVAEAQTLAREWRPTPWDVLMGRQITPTER